MNIGDCRTIGTNGRMCAKCRVRSIVSSYTKKGLMVVMCPKCGKTWNTKVEKCEGVDLNGKTIHS